MRDSHKVIIDKSKCIKCGLCINDCPYSIIEMTESGAKTILDKCIMCGHCLAICPSNAISITGFEDEPIEIKESMKINPDDFLNQMYARRSVRHFTNDTVTNEEIKKILKAGQYSPTALNRQDVTYVVLKDNIEKYEIIAVNIFRKMKKFASIFTNKFDRFKFDDNFLFKKAPVVIVIKSSNDVDGAIAGSSMEIMAQSLGLGVFYSGMFTAVANKSLKLRKMLGVDRKHKVITTLVIGRPKVKYMRTVPKERPTIIVD